jgi:hypothetical protein
MWYTSAVTTIRAHFDGRVFVPEEPVHLPASQSVELTVRKVEASKSKNGSRRGSPAAILEMMRSLPSLPSEWVDELEKAIEDGKIPPDEKGIFDDLR